MPAKRILAALRRPAFALALLALGGALVRQMSILDRLLIYYPEKGLASTPLDAGLDYEDVFLTAADGTRVHGWHIPGESRVTLLWLHGNAGNISRRLDNILLMRERLGAGVFIIDYRGYGLSEGKPSERGLYMDAEASFDWLVSERGLDAEREIVIFGRSLGAAVAVETAVRHKVRGVILESGFTSIADMGGRGRLSFLSRLTLPLFEARYDSASKIGGLQSPAMILHGDQDRTVPFEMSRRLYEAAPEPKIFYPIIGAGHNDTVQAGGDAYMDALRRFVFPEWDAD